MYRNYTHVYNMSFLSNLWTKLIKEKQTQRVNQLPKNRLHDQND